LFSYFPNKISKHKFQNPCHISNLWKTHNKNKNFKNKKINSNLEKKRFFQSSFAKQHVTKYEMSYLLYAKVLLSFNSCIRKTKNRTKKHNTQILSPSTSRSAPSTKLLHDKW
jgi:hypothetical protein